MAWWGGVWWLAICLCLGIYGQREFLSTTEMPLEWQVMSPTPIDVVFREWQILGPRTQSWIYYLNEGHDEKVKGPYFCELLICSKFLNAEYELSITNGGKLEKIDVKFESGKSTKIDVIRWSKTIHTNVTVSLYGMDVLQSKLETMFYSQTNTGGSFSYYRIPGPGCLESSLS